MFQNLTYVLPAPTPMMIDYAEHYQSDGYVRFVATMDSLLNHLCIYYFQFQARVLILVMNHCKMSPSQLDTVWKLFTYILLPVFYVYLARPAAPQITIQVPGAGAVLVREGPVISTDDMSQMESDIIYHLRRFQQGCTAKMLMRALLPVYPQVELEDVNRRLYSLQERGHVRSFDGDVVSRLWVAMI